MHYALIILFTHCAAASMTRRTLRLSRGGCCKTDSPSHSHTQHLEKEIEETEETEGKEDDDDVHEEEEDEGEEEEAEEEEEEEEEGGEIGRRHRCNKPCSGRRRVEALCDIEIS